MIGDRDQTLQVDEATGSEGELPRVYWFGTLPDGYEEEQDYADGTGD